MCIYWRMMIMPYKIALVDADNTLLDFSRSEHDALCDCLRARNLPTHQEITSRYAAINDFYWKQLELGLVTRESLRIKRFEAFFKEFGFHCDPTRMADDYMVALSSKSYLMDGALDFCRQVYGHCRLFVVTNGNTAIQKSRFDPSPLAPYFEGCFISEQMGCAKPERAFFEKVAESISEFVPSEVLVIGDSISSDIQGGINAGLDTCWFNPARRIRPEGIPMTYEAHTFPEIQRILLT